VPTLDRAVLERQPAIPLEAKAGEHLAFPLGAESHNPLDAFKRTKANVRFWHLADIDAAFENVRFWGYSGHALRAFASSAFESERTSLPRVSP